MRYIEARKARSSRSAEPCNRPSAYYDTTSRAPSAGQLRDEAFKPETLRINNSNFNGVYGAKKVWKQFRRKGIKAANKCVGFWVGKVEGTTSSTKGTQRSLTRRWTYLDLEVKEHDRILNDVTQGV